MTIPQDEIFRRRSEIIVGAAGSPDAIQLTNVDSNAQMRVVFNIEASLKPEPNASELMIYNLSPDSRKQLEETEDLVASISAGYIDNTFKIFGGELRHVTTRRDNQDLITTVESGDKEKAYREARINKGYAPGTQTSTVIRDLVKAMDVGEGNLADVILSLNLGDTGKAFRTGTVMSGLASMQLSEFCDAVGIEWSIQDGNAVFVQNGKPIAISALKVSPSSGLIGVPSVDNDGILHARTFMLPDVAPGRVIDVEAEFVQGRYRIEKATYTGDTRGNEWYIDVQGKRLG